MITSVSAEAVTLLMLPKHHYQENPKLLLYNCVLEKHYKCNFIKELIRLYARSRSLPYAQGRTVLILQGTQLLTIRLPFPSVYIAMQNETEMLLKFSLHHFISGFQGLRIRHNTSM